MFRNTAKDNRRKALADEIDRYTFIGLRVPQSYIPHCLNLLSELLQLLPPQEDKNNHRPYYYILLGNCLTDYEEGDIKNNQEIAFKAYTEALLTIKKETHPYLYFLAKQGRGDIYLDQNTSIALIEEDKTPEYLATWKRPEIEYAEALNAIPYLPATQLGRKQQINQTGSMYLKSAFCLLQIGLQKEAMMRLDTGKARSLKEILTLNSGINDKRITKDQQHLLSEFRRSLLAYEVLEENAEMMKSGKHEKEYKFFQEDWRKLQGLIQQIQKKFPDFMPTILGWKQILEVIPKGTAILMPLFERDGVMFIIANSPTSGITVINIPIHGVNRQLVLELVGDPGFLKDLFFWSLDAMAMESWHSSVKAFSHRVWSYMELRQVHPQLKKLGITQVMIIPQGGVGLLPIQAAWRHKGVDRAFTNDKEDTLDILRNKFARRDDDMEKKYFLDDYAVSYAPSIQSIWHINKNPTLSNRKALVIGVSKYLRMQPIESAVTEAKLIAKQFNTEPLLNEKATSHAIQGKFKGCEYLHFACHGAVGWDPEIRRNPMILVNERVYDYIDPNSAALFVANDEPIFVGSIAMKFDLRGTRLVILSACETGLTDLAKAPDEFPGLVSAFLKAGVRGVISSSWAVNSHSTTLLMDRFYRNHLQKKMEIPAALREAQLWIRDATRTDLGNYYKFLRGQDNTIQIMEAYKEIMSGDLNEKPYEEPHYWAAFTYTGA